MNSSGLVSEYMYDAAGQRGKELVETETSNSWPLQGA